MPLTTLYKAMKPLQVGSKSFTNASNLMRWGGTDISHSGAPVKTMAGMQRLSSLGNTKKGSRAIGEVVAGMPDERQKNILKNITAPRASVKPEDKAMHDTIWQGARASEFTPSVLPKPVPAPPSAGKTPLAGIHAPVDKDLGGGVWSKTSSESFIHFVDPSAEDDVKKNGLMTAQALAAAGRPEGATHLASYLKQVKWRPESQGKFDELVKELPEGATDNDKAVAAMKAIRGSSLAEDGGDWVYGFTKEQANRIRGVLARNRSKWLGGRIPYEVDVDGLRAAKLLMDAESLEAQQILAKRIKGNRLAGKPLLFGIPHPRVMVKDGIIPPQFLKRVELEKEGAEAPYRHDPRVLADAAKLGYDPGDGSDTDRRSDKVARGIMEGEGLGKGPGGKGVYRGMYKDTGGVNTLDGGVKESTANEWLGAQGKTLGGTSEEELGLLRDDLARNALHQVLLKSPYMMGRGYGGILGVAAQTAYQTGKWDYPETDALLRAGDFKGAALEFTLSGKKSPDGGPRVQNDKYIKSPERTARQAAILGEGLRPDDLDELAGSKPAAVGTQPIPAAGTAGTVRPVVEKVAPVKRSYEVERLEKGSTRENGSIRTSKGTLFTPMRKKP